MPPCGVVSRIFVNSRSSESLSQCARNPSPVSGYPITFAVDGKQYVAVATGPSGEATSTLRLTPELKPSATTQVVVFALP